MEKAILCDIDMTIFDTAHILKISESLLPPEKWQYFYEHLQEQKEMTWCIEMLKKMDMPVIFLTARCVTYADKTIPALDKLGIDYKLFMRAEGDFRDAWEVKKDHLEKLLKFYKFVFALDDEESNCKLFYEYGIPVLRVYYPHQI